MQCRGDNINTKNQISNDFLTMGIVNSNPFQVLNGMEQRSGGINKNMKIAICLMFLISCSILLTGIDSRADSHQNSEMEKVTLLLDWFPNVDHAPLYVAQENKIFGKHGLEVELLWGGDPDAPLKLVAAGEYPFAVSYQQSVTIARAGEEVLPVKSIGLLVEHPLNTITFLKKTGIKTPADFKGKKIGYTVAPLDVLLFNAIGANAGLSEDDYELINVGTNIVAPLLSGQIDAVIGPFRNYEINMLKLEGAEADYFALEKHGIPDYYELVIITYDAYLKNHPETAKKLMMAIQEAIQFTKEKPDDALQLFFKANPDATKELEELAFRDTLDVFATTQVQSAEKWAAFAKFAYEKGLISKTVEAKDCFINVLEESF